MAQAETTNTISRRSALVLSAAAIASSAGAVAATDPIFKAIEDHKRAFAAFGAAIDAQAELHDLLPKHLRQSHITLWDESIVATDDTRWIAADREVLRLMRADTDAMVNLINVKPTTVAGAMALIRHVAAFEAKRTEWPEDLEGDHGEPTTFYRELHKNIANALS